MTCNFPLLSGFCVEVMLASCDELRGSFALWMSWCKMVELLGTEAFFVERPLIAESTY